jgi:hypothetical protein
MQQNSQRPLELAPKSERVAQLLAACIRAAVRLRYSHSLSQSDSIDLARTHDLRSALKAISEKMDLHQNLPDAQWRFTLAVAESKLAPETDLGTANIIAIRKASVTTVGSNQSNASERQLALAALRTTQQEVRLWAKTYSRFLTEIENLYQSTNTQIESLHLTSSSRLKAQAELQKVIVNAIERAGEVPPAG